MPGFFENFFTGRSEDQKDLGSALPPPSSVRVCAAGAANPKNLGFLSPSDLPIFL
jgi:hypothetical protein